MAAPDLRVVRRRRGDALTASAPRALIAASTPVTNSAQIFQAGSVGRRNNWQAEAWELYRAVGELRYYVGWRANSCSRVRFVASEIDADTGEPTGSIAEDNREGQRVTEIVRKIAGGRLGQAQLTRRAAESLTVPGEVWIAILMRTEGTDQNQRQVAKWYAVTRREIEQGPRSNTVTIKLPDGTKHVFDQSKGDGMFRVWNPDAEDASLPDSPVQACLDSLREIVRTTKKIKNADNSRLLNNGLLFVPSEATLPDQQSPVAADKPGDSAPQLQPGRRVAASLQQMIVQVAETASKDENSMAALVPIVAAAPGDHLAKINHLEFGKDVTDTALNTREKAIARLATGLDMSRERLLGLSTGNHWSAWAIDDQDVQVHVKPVMEIICHAIYESVLRGMLIDEGIDPDKYILWYDASALTSDPDLTDETKDAFEKGAVTSEYLVRTYGIPDDAMYDFTSLEGWQQWAQDRVSQDPTLLRELLPLLDSSVQGIEFPEPVAALPPGQGDGEDDASGAEQQQEPDTEDDGSGVQASARANVELAVVDLMVGRALELAGKRRVRTNDREQHARLKGIPTHEYHRYMGPVDEPEVSRLIKGWDSIMSESALSRLGIDPDRVRAAVARAARKELTSQVIDGQVG
ncbi:hypothetical protein [Mycobacteroides abscessus]|uniref:hypothetical protein n=1 Tax=Mycobacteroides abscessus TaxID=36809 RepID=UPI0027DA7EBB|nr:hypothetical protein [Mycobacteroides abscessus]